METVGCSVATELPDSAPIAIVIVVRWTVLVDGLGYYVYTPFRFERIFHNKDFERSVLLPIVTHYN